MKSLLTLLVLLAGFEASAEILTVPCSPEDWQQIRAALENKSPSVVRKEDEVGQIATVLDISQREVGGECESIINTNQMDMAMYSSREYRVFDSNESFQVTLLINSMTDALAQVHVSRSKK